MEPARQRADTHLLHVPVGLIFARSVSSVLPVLKSAQEMLGWYASGQRRICPTLSFPAKE
jgi:hypothetical protein